MTEDEKFRHLQEDNKRLQRELDEALAQFYSLARRFSVLLDNLPHPIFIIDTSGFYREVYVSSMYTNRPDIVLGRKISPGKNIADILPPDLARERLEYIQLACETKEAIKYDYSLFNASRNRSQYYQAIVVPANGELALVAILDKTNEINERAQMQARIEQVKQSYLACTELLKQVREKLQTGQSSDFAKRLEDILRDG